jgi:hypothetical protein
VNRKDQGGDAQIHVPPLCPAQVAHTLRTTHLQIYVEEGPYPREEVHQQHRPFQLDVERQCQFLTEHKEIRNDLIGLMHTRQVVLQNECVAQWSKSL